ncbi:hypothetical protein PV760_13770 [Paenarthrobacter sp. CC6]|uniref:hypothetical protein n=1 Tax=Paenarthrobacter sp. CC6 TaxID=3029184 RepID=UPI00339C6D9B
MKKSLTLSTLAADAGQSKPQDLHSAEDTLQRGSEHNTAAAAGDATGSPAYDLSSQARLDLLRGLPSFGFEMVGDEPRTESASC